MPKLMLRMPLGTQRRNTAYLNRQIPRFAQLEWALDGQALGPGPDLRLISGARSTYPSDRLNLVLPTWTSR
jgi:hypothetical protein